jgi:hypothetical protein
MVSKSRASTNFAPIVKVRLRFLLWFTRSRFRTWTHGSMRISHVVLVGPPLRRVENPRYYSNLKGHQGDLPMSLAARVKTTKAKAGPLYEWND